MSSSRRKRSSRRTNIAQFVALVVSVGLIGGVLGLLGAGLALPAVGAAGAVVRAVPETFREIPSDLEVPKPSEGSRMLDADGHVLAQFFEERRTLVTSEQIAPIMKEAVIAIEDWRFMNHHGIDPDGMMRALVNNLSGGGREGASTITQQYVKNILVDRGVQEGDQDLIDEAQEVSIERKLREARLAVALEARMSKDEILTGYLNLATFGSNIYGVEAASRAYFSKSASELTVPEAALLAGIVKSPSDYDPLVHPEAAQDRRNLVLSEMKKRGYITQAEYREAVATPVEEMLNPENLVSGCRNAGTAAFFCQYALAEYMSDESFGEDRAERARLLNTGGLTLRTTLQQSKQAAAYQAVVDRVPVDDASGVNTLLVSVVPQTGAIVAMAQNTPFGVASESNPRATEVNFSVGKDMGGGTGFQAGSTFKMFTLVQWFSEGKSAYEPVGRNDRVFPNGSFKCNGSPIYTDAWEVGDIGGGSKNGVFDALRATQNSINQAFADMATKVDFCSIFEKAAAMGVVDGVTGETIAAYPGNIIGSASVSPLSMATAYATIANNGVKCDPMALTEVEGSDDGTIKSYTPSCAPVIDSTVAQQVATVLERTAQTYPYQIGRPYAAKSGTTDENDNTWMVGFVPQLATAGWAGYATASSTPVQNVWIKGEFYENVYGGTFIGPMWTQYMAAALADTPVEPIPEVFIGNKPLPAAPKTTTTKTPATPTTPNDTTTPSENTGNRGGQTGGQDQPEGDG